MGPIRIQIIAGTVQCSPDSGHVRVHARYTPQLEWVSADEEFTLSFVELFSGRKAWPFKQPPEPPVFQPTKYFKGTLKDVSSDPPPAYKYTVQAGGKVLDPIIIVDP
jgi:hypothetical protein